MFERNFWLVSFCLCTGTVPCHQSFRIRQWHCGSKSGTNLYQRIHHRKFTGSLRKHLSDNFTSSSLTRVRNVEHGKISTLWNKIRNLPEQYIMSSLRLSCVSTSLSTVDQLNYVEISPSHLFIISSHIFKLDCGLIYIYIFTCSLMQKQLIIETRYNWADTSYRSGI